MHTPDADHPHPRPADAVPSVQARRLAIISRVYREWAAEQDQVEAVAPADAEGAILMGADVVADADLDERIRAALAAEGIPFPGDGGDIYVHPTLPPLPPPD